MIKIDERFVWGLVAAIIFLLIVVALTAMIGGGV